MRILLLIYDAFGGQGGIAKFNRDLMAVLDTMPEVTEIVALPRYLPEPPGPLPRKLVFDLRSAHGKFAFFLRCLRWFTLGGCFELVISGHVNFVPISVPWWVWRWAR